MPVSADPLLLPWFERLRADLPGLELFDVHTHLGRNDPDGFKQTPAELLEHLMAAGARAAVFPMHEPAGYPPANDAVLEAALASRGRLTAFCRVDPRLGDAAVAEARRMLDAGARGIKLHPRAEDFALDAPAIRGLAALADERGVPILIHAGRGIPALGRHTVALAGEFHAARFILAHAGISDLGWIGPPAAELDNVLFDTSWWQAGDLLSLYATVPPGRIVYASDAPYGSSLFAAWSLLRYATTLGLEGDALTGMAGGTLRLVLDGEPAPDLGPAPGLGRLAQRDLGFERVLSYLTTACQMSFRGGDPAEALSLAALACERVDGHEVAPVVAELVDATFAAIASRPALPAHAVFGALVGQVLAGTAAVGL